MANRWSPGQPDKRPAQQEYGRTARNGRYQANRGADEATAPPRYYMNPAYDGHIIGSTFRETSYLYTKPKSQSQAKARRQREKPQRIKPRKENRRRNVLLVGILAIILIILLAIALAIGLSLGYPDVMVSAIVEDILWETAMKNVNSTAFKSAANNIEQSLDAYYQKTPMKDIYQYAVVTNLWQGSVGCNARLYLKAPTNNTEADVRTLYNNVKSGVDLQKISVLLQEGQQKYWESVSANNGAPFWTSVKFKFDTVQISVPSTTAKTTLSVTSNMKTTTIASTLLTGESTTTFDVTVPVPAVTEKSSTSTLVSDLTSTSNISIPTGNTSEEISVYNTTSANSTGEITTVISSGETTTSYSVKTMTMSESPTSSTAKTNISEETTAVSDMGSDTTKSDLPLVTPSFNSTSTVSVETSQVVTQNSSDVTETTTQDIEELTSILKERELWVWYNHQWNPVCKQSLPKSVGDLVCRMNGYSHGLLYDGTFLRDAVNFLNLSCESNVTSLGQCTQHFILINRGSCYSTNVHCFNTGPEYQLVGGDGSMYGYAKVKWDEKEAFICSKSEYTNTVASTLCYEVNKQSYKGIVLKSTSQLRSPTNPDLWLIDALCFRTNENLSFLNCVKSGWLFVGNASYVNDTSATDPSMLTLTNIFSTYDCLKAIYCYSKPVGLHSGPLRSFGILYDTNAISPRVFCRDTLTTNETNVICKMFGFVGPSKTLNYNPFPWTGSLFWIYANHNYTCNGSENTIEDCLRTNVDYISSSQCTGPAVVRCSDAYVLEKDFTVKLAEDGRTVLVSYQNQWGTICDQNDKAYPMQTVAKIVCRQLGFLNGTTRRVHTKVNENPHIITRITCNDNVELLANCSFELLNDDSCVEKYPLEVYCYNENQLAKIELEKGLNTNRGEVIVTYNGEEGYLCYSETGGVQETVLCRNLGFKSGEGDFHSSSFNLGLPTIWSTNLTKDCNNLDNVIALCQSSPWINYSLTEFPTICQNGPVSVNCYGNVRLSSGFQNKTGAVLFYDTESYFGICHEDLTQNATDAVCRELFGSPAFKGAILPPGTYKYPQDTLRNVQFSCLSDSNNATECINVGDFNALCQDASVLCYEGEYPQDQFPSVSKEWQLRENGIVLVKGYDTWGTVCRSHWTDLEATVLCKTLDSNNTLGYVSEVYRTVFDPIWLGGVKCEDNATNINECTTYLYNEGISICQYGGITRVFCFKSNDDVPKIGLVDVVETQQYHSGYISVSRNNQTGYFCPLASSDNAKWQLTDYEADYFCSNFNYLGGKLSRLPAVMYSLNATWMLNFDCNLDEFLLGRCNFHGTLSSGIHYKGDLNPSNVKSTDILDEGICNETLPRLLCFTSKVRLEDPELPEGFMLIANSGEWYGLCADTFNVTMATKFCIEAGYKSGSFVPVPKSQSDWTAGFREVNCANPGTKLKDCSFVFSPYSCDKIVYITCSDLFKVGLADPSDNGGYLVIQDDTHNWSTVCSNGTETLSDEICMKINYQCGAVASVPANQTSVKPGFSCEDDWETCEVTPSSLDCESITYLTCSNNCTQLESVDNLGSI